MTWDQKNDCYLLKFRLNLYKKFRGIPSGADFYEEFLQDCSIPITKRNVLSVACQFYDPKGLTAPLMFSVRSVQRSLPGLSMFHEFRTVWSPCCKVLHCCKSWERLNFLSLDRLFTMVLVNSTNFSMAVCKVMVSVFTFVPRTWSTCCTVLQKWWESQLSQLLVWDC